MSKIEKETNAMKNKMASFPDVTMLLNFSANALPYVWIHVQRIKNIAASGEPGTPNTCTSSSQDGTTIPKTSRN
jgi:hypothetical protein